MPHPPRLLHLPDLPLDLLDPFAPCIRVVSVMSCTEELSYEW
jgi:hypothetical protein